MVSHRIAATSIGKIQINEIRSQCICHAFYRPDHQEICLAKHFDGLRKFQDETKSSALYLCYNTVHTVPTSNGIKCGKKNFLKAFCCIYYWKKLDLRNSNKYVITL